MPFFDDLGKTIGKASQAVTNAAKDISDGFQSVKDGIQAAQQESKASSMGKCPNCGQQLSAMQAVCPLCGYELQNKNADNSVAAFSREISNLEKSRNAIADKLVSVLSGRSGNVTDEKIASVIRAYIVPNTKGEIFEFMLLASSNMDAKLLAGRKDAEGTTPEIIVRAWASKFEQTYQKARLSFGNDVDFSKIQELYERKMQEIEDAKPRGLFSRRK